jgi:hypothetical protein
MKRFTHPHSQHRGQHRVHLPQLRGKLELGKAYLSPQSGVGLVYEPYQPRYVDLLHRLPSSILGPIRLLLFESLQST